MKIGIVGAGNIGKALGGSWEAAGHEIRFGTRAEAGSIFEAASWAETIVLAVPAPAALEALEEAAEVGGKLVVDCTNRMGAPSFEKGRSTAEELAAAAPDAYVFKAFNAAFSKVIANRGKVHGQKADLAFCGDGEVGRERLEKLINDAGFMPLDCGPLENAYLVEALGAAMIYLGFGANLGTDIAWKMIR
jgi:predicted dinucleotide-binding enzyme